MEAKYRIDFDEGNVLESVTYTLVSEYDLKPNILRADITDYDSRRTGNGFLDTGSTPVWSIFRKS